MAKTVLAVQKAEVQSLVGELGPVCCKLLLKNDSVKAVVL